MSACASEHERREPYFSSSSLASPCNWAARDDGTLGPLLIVWCKPFGKGTLQRPPRKQRKPIRISTLPDLSGPGNLQFLEQEYFISGV